MVSQKYNHTDCVTGIQSQRDCIIEVYIVTQRLCHRSTITNKSQKYNQQYSHTDCVTGVQSQRDCIREVLSQKRKFYIDRGWGI